MPAKKKDDPPKGNVYAFVGTDDMKVKEAALQASRKLISPESADFGLEIVEGAADNSEHAQRICRQAVEALQTIPFMGGEKLVWLKDANFFADTVSGRAEGTLQAADQLLTELKRLPSDVKFLLSAGDIDKRRSFYLGVKSIAEVQVFDAIDTSKGDWQEQVARLVEDRALEHGLDFTPVAMELFVLLAGEQTRQIENELEKLDIYMGDESRTVEIKHVREIVSQSKDGVVFDLGNAIGARDLPEALELVDQLMYQGESAMGILLAAIVPKVRNLFLARELAESYGARVKDPKARWGYGDYTKLLEKLPAEVQELIPKKKDGGLNAYPVYLASIEGQNYTATELRTALEECLKANRRLVTSQLDAKLVLDQLLLRVLTKAPRKAAPPAASR